MSLVLTKASDESLGVTVVQALAAARGEDPAAMDFDLGSHLDPDALQRLYRHGTGENGRRWRVEFSADGFDVRVRSDGVVRVE